MTAASTQPSRSSTLTLLGALYITQFLGVGFLFTALSAILRQRGASLEQISTIQVLGLVWAIKFLWAPLLDRYGSRRRGHYRGWLLVLQPAIVLAVLGMIAVDPIADFGSLMIVAALVVLMSATQDIAADGLAVRLLTERDRGLGNGFQVGGGYLGNILGGGAVLLVYDAFGWPPAIVALAVFTAIPIYQVWRYREPVRSAADDEVRPGHRTMLSVFRRPGVARWSLATLPLMWVPLGAAYALVTPMLVDAGWSLTAIGTLTTMVAGGFALVAAVGGGVVVRWIGRRGALLAIGGVQVAAILGLLPLAAGSDSRVLTAVVVIAINATYAAISAVVYTVNMDMCRRATAGSDFTLLSTVPFVLSLVAGAVGLNIAEAVGYPATVTGSAVLLVLALLVASRTVVERTPPAPAADPEPETGDLSPAT